MTRWRHYQPVVLAVCAGIGFSFVVLAVLRSRETHTIEARFNDVAEDRASAVTTEIRANLNVLESVRCLFLSSEEVERHEFKEFVAPLVSRQPAVHSIEWAPRVPEAERLEYEAAARPDGFEDLQITERDARGSMVRASTRHEYFPVYFIEPHQGDKAALGFDLASDPTQLDAIRRSRDTGEAAITARIAIEGGTQEEFGVRAFLPLYGKGMPTDTVEHRRESFLGCIVGTYEFAEVFKRCITRRHPQGINTYAQDNSAPAGQRFLYFHLARTEERPYRPGDEREAAHPKGMHVTTDVEVGGRQWSLVCTPASGCPTTQRTWYSWGLLAGGLLFTALLGMYLAAITRRTSCIERLVEQQTHDLSERAKELNCLYTISTIIEVSDRSLEEMCREVAAVISSAWQYPEITCARIVLEGEQFATSNFEQTTWSQDAPICVRGQPKGTVEVCYLEERPEADEGPFNKEERALINTISEQLGRFVERKRAEDALRRSQEFLQTVIDAMPDTMMVIGHDYRVIHANRAARKLSGEKDPVTDCLKCHQVLRNSDAPCEELTSSCPLQQTVATRTPVRVEHIHYDPEGNEVFVEVSSAPVFDETGEVVQIVESCRDVTDRKHAEDERKKSELKFRTLYESSIDAVMLFDEKCFIDCNDATVKIFGCKSKEVFCTKHPADLSPANQPCGTDSMTLANERIGTAMQTGRNCFEWMHKRIDSDEAFPAEVLLNAMDLGGRQVLQAVVRDITERKRAEKQLREYAAATESNNLALEQLNEAAEAANRQLEAEIAKRKCKEQELVQAQKLEAIGQLAAGIAHEINTPSQYIGDNIRFLEDAFGDIDKVLGTFNRLLEAAKDHTLTDELVARVEDALREADMNYLANETPKAIRQSLEGVGKVAEIVRAMKEFSHPGGDEKQAVDVNRAIESTLTVSRNEWKYVADLATDFDRTLPLVPCFPSEFNQVILNLVVNSAQAISDLVGDNSEDKGTITVSTRHDGEWVEIRVQDTGTGIPEEVRSKVFDHFFTTKEVGKGTGQGLTIAHSIITEKHGGTITFETEAGRGTTFIVRVPIADDPLPEQDIQPEEAEIAC